MFHTDRVIVVEGKYDKMRLSGLTDALILTTEGFGVFSDREKQTFLKKLAKEKGLLILTDSDAAGFRIRAFLRRLAGDADVVNVFIPDIYGKEKRKEAPSKEGKLGVEGVDNALLLRALAEADVFSEGPAAPRDPITTADLYALGLTGKPDATEKRRALLQKLGLPARLTGTLLLQTLNAYTDKKTLYEKASG